MVPAKSAAPEGGSRMSALGPGRVKTLYPPPKTARNQRRSTSTGPSKHIFAVSSLESTRAQPRATLSDLNGHTARTTARAPHARIATRRRLDADDVHHAREVVG